MRAIVQERAGGPDVLVSRDLPIPEPGSGEVRVRVVAAGVNPVDRAVREGRPPSGLDPRFPFVPGFEVAGLIDALGPGAGRFRKGDRVWAAALRPEPAGGGYAEFVAVPEDHAAAMPAGLLYEEAAAVPLACASVWPAIVQAGIGAGATVVVRDAAGGIGRIAVQVARHAGATVIGIASRADQPRLAEFGAHHTIAIEDGDVREAIRRLAPGGVDRVFDGDDFPAPPSADALARIAGLVKDGALSPRADRIWSLGDAAEAQESCREPYCGVKAVLAL